MKYLTIRFENASLILPNKSNRPMKGYQQYTQGVGITDYDECDLENPIGADQLSNVLHVMCGLAPVPTKRKTIFTRNEELYNIAKNSYIKYDKGCNNDIDRKSEMFQASKYAEDSHLKVSTKIGDEVYNGFYNWAYFLRRFYKNKDLLKKILNFFNKVLSSENVMKDYKFDEFVIEFHKHLSDDDVKTFDAENRKAYSGKGSPLGGPFYTVIFETKKPLGNNTVYFQSTPILTLHSVEYKKGKLSGTIIIPIENEHIIEQIRNCGCNPTILDGGLVTIVGLKNRINETILETDYTKIH